MLLLPFLNNRQLGGIRKAGHRASDNRINFDDQLSRLVNCSKDVYPTGVQCFGAPPFACKFRKDKELDLLAVANEDGELLLINTESNKVVKSFMAHHNAIFDICWLPNKYQLITASGDHRAKLFDMNTLQVISSYAGHVDSVKSVDLCPTDSDIFATGSKDGNINVWDRRERSGQLNDKPSISISSAHCRTIKYSGDRRKYWLLNNSYSSVSSVAFQSNNHLVSSGVADGIIKVWDLRKTYIKNRTYSPRYQIKYCGDKTIGHGCSSLVFDSLYKKLYACTTTNTIYQFDCHSYSNNHVTYTGFKCKTYFVKIALSCDDQYLLCGSSNHKAYIWKTTKPGKPLLALPGHSAEVTSVEWSPYNSTKLVTCGDDNKVLAWSTQGSNDVHSKLENEVLFADIEDADISDSDSQSFTPVSIRNSSHSTNAPKTSTIKSIKNFFSPVASSLSVHASNSAFTVHSTSSESETSDSDSLPQSRFPCETQNNEINVALAKENTLPPKTLSVAHISSSNSAFTMHTFRHAHTCSSTSETAALVPSSQSRSPCKTPNDNEITVASAKENTVSPKTLPVAHIPSSFTVHALQHAPTGTSTNETAVLVPSPQSRSPCKPLNDNEITVVPAKESAMTPKTILSGKENNIVPGTSAESSNAAERSGFLKRKSDNRESRLSCKYHPEGCGKTKGHTRCGKKIKIVPHKHNIKSYFTVSSPE